MENLLADWRKTVEESFAAMTKISQAKSEIERANQKWSRKEIIGHLIDSAANNHQRFVRVQLQNNLSLPGYEQKNWVDCQGYREESWRSLLELWRSYNLHLIRVTGRIPADKLQNICRIETNDPVTLEFLVTDYVIHLKCHLEQICREIG